jgi:hypothetical protein
MSPSPSTVIANGTAEKNADTAYASGINKTVSVKKVGRLMVPLNSAATSASTHETPIIVASIAMALVGYARAITGSTNIGESATPNRNNLFPTLKIRSCIFRVYTKEKLHHFW